MLGFHNDHDDRSDFYFLLWFKAHSTWTNIDSTNLLSIIFQIERLSALKISLSINAFSHVGLNV